MRSIVVVLALVLSACDSSSSMEEPAPETGPSGAFAMESLFYRLSRIVDASNGITEDIQGTIEGTLGITEADGELSGSGTCSWTTRIHTARLGRTVEESGTSGFSVSGTIDGDAVRVVLQGCAWAQVGYRGTFSSGQYALRVPDGTDAPLFGPDVWSQSTQIDGDDPQELVLNRR